MARGTYEEDYKGLGRYLRESAALKRCVKGRAEHGARIARTFAPVGTDSPHPGEFRDSIRVIDHPLRTRYAARIIADARDALWAEIGRTRTRRYEGHRTLKRTAQILHVPRRVL